MRRAFAALAGTDSLWLIAEVGRWCSRVYRQLGDPAAERELLTQARDLYAVKCVTTWDDEIAARLSELACEPSEM